MSNQPDGFEDSIFDAAEAPDADAARVDEGAPADGKEVTADGHLRKTVPLGDIDPYDHSQEQQVAKSAQAAAGTAPPELPQPGPVPLNNPAMTLNPADMVRDEMAKRFASEFGKRNVEVTVQERDAFVRAALHDSELTFRIELPGIEAVVDVVIPPDIFTTTAAAATYHWGREGYIDKDSDLQWLLTFQQMHALFQIRAINGEPTPWSDLWVDGLPRISELRDLLRNQYSLEPIFKLNAVRWRMCCEATQIAEYKYKLCLENWQNRTFFTGADTA